MLNRLSKKSYTCIFYNVPGISLFKSLSYTCKEKQLTLYLLIQLFLKSQFLQATRPDYNNKLIKLKYNIIHHIYRNCSEMFLTNIQLNPINYCRWIEGQYSISKKSAINGIFANTHAIGTSGKRYHALSKNTVFLKEQQPF